MKILHIGQMIGGLDIYIRNSIIYNKVEGNEYVIVCGKDGKDKLQPVIGNGEKGYLLPLDADAYADKIIRLVNDKELRISMEEKSRALFLVGFFIENRIKYLQNQCKMVCDLRYGGVNHLLLKTSVDTVIWLSVGFEATLHREKKRVAA